MDDTQQLIEKLFDSKLDGLKDLLTGVKDDIEKLDAKMEAHINTGERESLETKVTISALEERIKHLEQGIPNRSLFEVWKEESIKWAVPLTYLFLFWLVASNGANQLWTSLSHVFIH